MESSVLIGKTIQAIFLNDDQETIKFVCEDGSEIFAETEGDCCSHTWIEDLINPEAVIGSPVLSVEDLDMPEDSQTATKTEHYEQEMAYYGLAIKTANGCFTIAYRNSSNGYYGGWMNWGSAGGSSLDKWKPAVGN